MLRVGLVASNFLEAPNGGGAGGNQQPASSSSLRERCGGRGINLHAAPNDSRAVALRTREHLAELHQAQPATLWCARRVPDQPNLRSCYKRGRTWLTSNCGHRSTAARLFWLSDT